MSKKITKMQLFQQQAPAFNFELSEDELLARALEVGFLTPIDGETDLYEINEEYWGDKE